MRTVSIRNGQVNRAKWGGSQLVLLVGEAKAMLSGGVTERTKSLCQIASATGVLSAMRLLQDGLEPDLVLMDMHQPDVECLDALSRLRSLRPDLRIILFSEATDPQVIVRAFRMGAEDILPKPCSPSMFENRLELLLARRNRCQDVGELPDEVQELRDGSFVVFASAAMRLIRAQAELVAKADCPVLCVGEMGTGKEEIARLLHQLSPRSNRPFLKISCAALPMRLLEGELFGYVQGAFIGARRSKPGKFELCSGGTLLLDDIEAMSPLLQSKLLDVLNDHEFARIGGANKIRVEPRIIAATSVDVKTAIAAGTLREDLFRRLSAFVFQVPPLRERSEDIPMLLQHCMDLFVLRDGLPARRITPQLMRRCQEYAWPGNVRELESFVKRYLVRGVESFDQSSSERRPIGRELTALRDYAEGVGELMGLRALAEATAITTALESTHWNRKAAAGLLGISYNALLRKIRRYDIDGRANHGTSQRRGAEMLSMSKA